MHDRKGHADLMKTDEQLGQLYELMKAIQNRGTEGQESGQ